MQCSSRRIAHAIYTCVLLAFSASGAESPPPQDAVEAVWRPQRLMFQYRSEGNLYSCDVLEEKIRRILYGLGASERLEVRRVSCRDFAAIARHEVIMESPVIATAENIRDITESDDRRDELIARVNGVQLPSAAELERFPAVWQLISFRRAPKIRLEDRDCGLVQQLRRQILPKMSVKVNKASHWVDCSRLTVVALVRSFGNSRPSGFESGRQLPKLATVTPAVAVATMASPARVACPLADFTRKSSPHSSIRRTTTD